MKLSIDKALRKGIKFHKSGKAKEASKYYKAVLKAQPKHPDANHNMGLLVIGGGKVEAAIPFFKMALEANPSKAQFWLSYINALIQLERIDEAMVVFDQAKSKGAKGDEFDQIEKMLADKQFSTNIASNVQDPPKSKLQALINLYTKEQFEKVLDESSQLVIHFPKSITLHNLIGVANRALGKFEEAIDAYSKALSIKPDYAEAYRNMGNAFQDQFKLEEAIDSYNKALSIKPDYAVVHNSMGNALTKQGKFEEAIEAYNKALGIKSDYVEAHNSMAVALIAQGKLNEAKAYCEKALIIEPNFADTYRNLGDALQEEGKLEEAVEAYTKALSIKPDYVDAYNNLGNALKKWGNIQEAIEAYNKAISIKPDYVEAHNSMAVALIAQGKFDEAKAYCEKALSLEPDNSQVAGTLIGAKHILSSLNGKTTNSAPREYVENLFNSYAGQFDQELVDKLEYNIPKKIAELAVEESASNSLGSILDLGCGTGLTGVEVKSFCSNLEGLDLSNKMLRIARKKNIYDKLSHMDIVDYLSNAELDFDYFISADVFVYIGELSEVFRLIKSRNKKPGKLIFSTEHTKKNGFHLQTSGRYSHSKNYIENLCKKFGYSLSHFSETDLRKEHGVFLVGGLYLLDF